MPTFNERILILADMFERSGTSYAFGGAIAYTYYGEPRVTRDIDINVFVDETNSEPILALLREAGLSFETGEQAALVRRDGQVRIPWDTVPVDLFFSNMPFHDSCRERVHHVPFSGRQITILSPEDLLVCKIAYNREKDWLDIEEIVHTQQTALDLAYIRRWLDTILGSNDGRVERFNRLVT